jgi:hypothetical protein
LNLTLDPGSYFVGIGGSGCLTCTRFRTVLASPSGAYGPVSSAGAYTYYFNGDFPDDLGPARNYQNYMEATEYPVVWLRRSA